MTWELSASTQWLLKDEIERARKLAELYTQVSGAALQGEGTLMTRPLYRPITHCNATVSGWLQETAEAMNALAAKLDAAGPAKLVPPDETVFATEAITLCKDLHRLFALWAKDRPEIEANISTAVLKVLS